MNYWYAAAAISVATSLGCSHSVAMLDNEKSEETDLQFLPQNVPSPAVWKSVLRVLSISSAPLVLNKASASRSHEKWKRILLWRRRGIVSRPCRWRLSRPILFWLNNPWGALLLLHCATERRFSSGFWHQRSRVWIWAAMGQALPHGAHNKTGAEIDGVHSCGQTWDVEQVGLPWWDGSYITWRDTSAILSEVILLDK